MALNDVASASSNIVPRDSRDQTSSAMDVDVIVNRPFAMVDEIADASPAAEDGLQLGDQIVKFGNVEAGDNLLQRLALEAQSNQGCEIPVTLTRQGALVNTKVTPRTWQGRGLLGYVSVLFLVFVILLNIPIKSYFTHAFKGIESQLVKIYYMFKLWSFFNYISALLCLF